MKSIHDGYSSNRFFHSHRTKKKHYLEKHKSDHDLSNQKKRTTKGWSLIMGHISLFRCCKEHPKKQANTFIK